MQKVLDSFHLVATSLAASSLALQGQSIGTAAALADMNGAAAQEAVHVAAEVDRALERCRATRESLKNVLIILVTKASESIEQVLGDEEAQLVALGDFLAGGIEARRGSLSKLRGQVLEGSVPALQPESPLPADGDKLDEAIARLPAPGSAELSAADPAEASQTREAA